ncbi:hypothetical protein, variant [Fonticula alba]|nr:hypothetical protein, variant [Fonticula alba]KCV71660.1 hypothetical protein, variant [Fonticula alba]|eukprot:XP_009493237.1 hypothetical protein, variant [Fonticula alba]
MMAGSSSMQGWRVTMEDAHLMQYSLRAGVTSSLQHDDARKIPPPNLSTSGLRPSPGEQQTRTAQDLQQYQERVLTFGPTMSKAYAHHLSAAVPFTGETELSLFAVMDGHGGSECANFAAKHLAGCVLASKHYSSGDYGQALYDAFLDCDSAFFEASNNMSGCAAIAVGITNDKIYCANAGDARAVLCRSGLAIPLSIDHKPTLPGEVERIQEAGGFIHNGRVNGSLALSRALGDFSFKQHPRLSMVHQPITAAPDIVTVDRNRETDEFLIVACDGIWDMVTCDEAADFVREHLAFGLAPSAVAERLLTRCLAPSTGQSGLGCDNMTCIIITLGDKSAIGSSPEDFVAHVASRATLPVVRDQPPTGVAACLTDPNGVVALAQYNEQRDSFYRLHATGVGSSNPTTPGTLPATQIYMATDSDSSDFESDPPSPSSLSSSAAAAKELDLS